MHAYRLQSGFTLLELAVVLALVGLMAAFGVAASNGLKDVQCNGKTAEQLARIQVAVQSFVASNGRLPKPALVTLGSSNGEFGKEVTALPHADLADTGNVLIGSLPHVALGLPIELAADCWGNKFTYAVTETLTSNDPSTGYGPNAGAIILRTGTRAASQDLITNSGYVVISHGANRIGATPLSSTNIGARWCSLGGGAEIDRENCDITNDVFFDGVPNHGDVAQNAYDDLIAFESKFALCPAQTIGWGVGCSDSVLATAIGDARTLNNSAAGYIGSAVATCALGGFVLSSETCALCIADGQPSGGNPAACCNGDSDGDGVCGGPVCNWTLAGQQCEPYGTYGPTEFCSNRDPSVQSECWVEIGGPGCGGSDVMVERYTSSCGSPPPCIADGQPAGGNPAACCNGDADGNGTCGTQAACTTSWTLSCEQAWMGAAPTSPRGQCVACGGVPESRNCVHDTNCHGGLGGDRCEFRCGNGI